VPRRYHLSHAAEKSEYDKHQNDVFDPFYRQFLSRLASPIFDIFTEKFQAYAKGLKPDQNAMLTHLDFGSGPGPALSVMFSEQGFNSECFDIFYNNDLSLLRPTDDHANQLGRYDVVTLTEVIEHLTDPWTELERLWQLLNRRGLLGLMTKLVTDLESFQHWHYKNDPTHIAFYSLQTLDFLAKRLGGNLEIVAKDAFILRKSD
jgi:hypothetical protein